MQELLAMDVNFIRKWRIAGLIVAEGKGGQKKFAEKVGSDPAHISNLLNVSSKRNIGDDLAHRIEDAYAMPRGSLDFPDERAQTAFMKFVLLDDEDKQQAIDFISFKYDQADSELVQSPAKLASYLKAIAKMIRDREEREKKPK
jgi:transcriptional regulator with XRE-family HTH domain